MGQFSYQEIFYSSSEKGIFTGNAGFGVRTCTRGMDSIDVDKIVEACATGYSVYNERILDMDRILANPDIVYDYPPVYLFRTVDLNDGSKRYVFGRTVYLGVDYGYFKGINAYDRAGTNYLTHLLVFNEKPSVAFIRDLLLQDKYMPLNYSCSPNNIELQKLLTGNPEFLEEKSFEPDATPILEESSIDCSSFIKGVVQMLKNRELPPETEAPKKMYVKSPWKSVESCLKSLDVLPRNSIESLQYVTNYMQGYGIPDGYDIAFVNEYNEAELYEDNYITADLFSSANKNVSNNLIINNIGNLVRQKDATSAAKLIQFYLDLKDIPESEYEFYYNIFLGAVSDLDIKLSDLTETTIKKLKDIKLDSAQSAKFWGKVNKALNEGLTATQGSDFLLAVDKIKLFNAYCPGKVHIQNECINYLTNILFSGRGNFGKIANDSNISTLLMLVNKSLIPSEELFLSSLGENSKVKVWEDSLEFYYKGQYDGNESILESILNSSLSDASICGLISKMFPLSRYADTLFDYFKNHTADTVKANSIVSSLVRYYGEKRFSDFVWLGQLEPEFIKVSSPIITSHYQEKVENNAKFGVAALFEFIEKVGSEQISALNLWGVLKTAAQKYLRESLTDITQFVTKIEDLEIDYRGHLDNEMDSLTCMVNQEIPKYISAPYIESAIRFYSEDDHYIERLISSWIRNGASKEELRSFVKANKNALKDSIIEGLVKFLWTSSSLHGSKEKQDLVLLVIDNCGWSQKKVEEFGLRCGNKELEKFLLKSNNLFDKIVRKLFK